MSEVEITMGIVWIKVIKKRILNHELLFETTIYELKSTSYELK